MINDFWVNYSWLSELYVPNYKCLENLLGLLNFICYGTKFGVLLTSIPNIYFIHFTALKCFQ